MKIAILTSGILPVPSVSGGAVENLIDFYLKYNEEHHLHDITVYSVDHPLLRQHPFQTSSINHYYYVNIHSLWSKIKRKIYSFQNKKDFPYNHYISYYFEQSLKHIKKQKYDIIILENRPGYALRLANETQAKLVYHLHNDFLSIRTPDYKRIYNSANKIITVSNYISNQVRTINPNDSKCVTVYNGIDLDSFIPKKHSIIKREHFGFNEGDFIIVFSGRINKDKGISELIDALLILYNYPHIKLLVLGSSFFGNASSDDDFIFALKEKARSLQDRVSFTGFIPYQEVPSYLRIADIAVLPSIWEEPFGLTVLESMAVGLPLITTRSGGIPEVCGDTAIMVARKNICNQIADAILYLYHNPQERKSMSESSLNRSRLFSKESYAENFFNALISYL